MASFKSRIRLESHCVVSMKQRKKKKKNMLYPLEISSQSQSCKAKPSAVSCRSFLTRVARCSHSSLSSFLQFVRRPPDSSAQRFVIRLPSTLVEVVLSWSNPVPEQEHRLSLATCLQGQLAP